MLNKLIIKERDYTKKNFSASDFGKSDLDLWFALKNEPKTNPPKWFETLKFGAGKGVEMQMLQILKDSGIVDQEYEQEKHGRMEMERNGIKITGYIDAITLLKNPIEIKSINNKNDFDIKKYADNYPRENYVGQLSVYQDFLGSDKGGLFVASVDGLNTFFFENRKISDGLYKCGNVTVDVNKEYERWAHIWELHQKGEMPDLLKYRYKTPVKEIDWKSIGAAKISKARNNKAVIGDWQVQYSSWKDLIIKLQGDTLGYTDEELEYIKEQTKGYTKW